MEREGIEKEGERDDQELERNVTGRDMTGKERDREMNWKGEEEIGDLPRPRAEGLANLVS